MVSPHAGYPYSGEVAAWAYSAIPSDFAGTIVVVGPSHRGHRTSVSFLPWETPLGILDNDTWFAEALDILQDEVSHQEPENSLEVQMPFIKSGFPGHGYAGPDGRPEPDACRRAGRRHTRSGKAHRKGSKDSRIERLFPLAPDAQAREQDLYAIEALSMLDIPDFYRRIASRGVSACGYGPIATMCLTCRGLGAREGRLFGPAQRRYHRGFHGCGYAAVR